MDADGLFIGDATLRKIFCLQETLRRVWGRPPLSESLLQLDRVRFLPSPLLQKKTAVSETPAENARRHVTPTLFKAPFINASTCNLQHTSMTQDDPTQQKSPDWSQMEHSGKSNSHSPFYSLQVKKQQTGELRRMHAGTFRNRCWLCVFQDFCKSLSSLHFKH